jgi:hypothetical protein
MTIFLNPLGLCIVEKDKTPEPLVVNACPLVPSVAGKV